MFVCDFVWWQYADIMNPLLSSIEAVTEHCQRTLTALAAAAADDSDNDATIEYFKTLEVLFCILYTYSIIRNAELKLDESGSHDQQ